jgi:hypothetical protein
MEELRVQLRGTWLAFLAFMRFWFNP